MNPVELIVKKRNGEALSVEEITWFINSYLEGSIPEYQMSAMLMAIYFQGMSDDEIIALTKCYIESGKQLQFPTAWHTVDKHSTGGVGDKITLMLAPIVAALGGKIPMISGRGLGHTGGTLDKLEAIPGYRIFYTDEEFSKQVEDFGLAIIGQTGELVPADKRIYALRDVTGTVESLPLITASIMSKKLAEGAQNLVIDLKVGRGAFMGTLERAKELARLLKMTGERFGQRVSVVFTNMNSPLGEYVGNGLEVLETVEYLKGKQFPDVDAVTRALAEQMLLLTDLCHTREEAEQKITEVIQNGKALEYFRIFVAAQGGNPAITTDLSILPQASCLIPIHAEGTGWVKEIDCRAIGYALIGIGAGRMKIEDELDYGTGARLFPKVGQYVTTKEPIGYVYAREEESGKAVAKRIAQAYTISIQEVKPEPIIWDIWSGC